MMLLCCFSINSTVTESQHVKMLAFNFTGIENSFLNRITLPGGSPTEVSFLSMYTKVKYMNRFKQLYQEKTGKELSDTEALEHLEKLISLVKVVYKPIPKDNNLTKKT